MFAYFLILIDVCPGGWLMAHQPDLPQARQNIEQSIYDLSFGERQVEQFACDRPGTGKVINREPVLRMMLVWYFAGELKGSRVYWDCREPMGGQRAEHLPSYYGYPVMTRVTNERGTSANDKCAMLLFELLNSEADKEYQSATSASAENRKSRDDFATSCVRCEFEAMKKTQLYFLEHPFAEANFKDDSYYCALITPQGDFAQYLRFLDGLDDKAYNPLKYYRQAYDGMFPSSAH